MSLSVEMSRLVIPTRVYWSLFKAPTELDHCHRPVRAPLGEREREHHSVVHNVCFAVKIVLATRKVSQVRLEEVGVSIHLAILDPNWYMLFYRNFVPLTITYKRSLQFCPPSFVISYIMYMYVYVYVYVCVCACACVCMYVCLYVLPVPLKMTMAVGGPNVFETDQNFTCRLSVANSW